MERLIFRYLFIVIALVFSALAHADDDPQQGGKKTSGKPIVKNPFKVGAKKSISVDDTLVFEKSNDDTLIFADDEFQPNQPPAGKHLNERFSIVNGETMSDADNVLMYPNPSYGDITLALPQGSVCEKRITILSASGQIVGTYSFTQEIKISGLAPGIYTITVNDGKHSTAKRLFVK